MAKKREIYVNLTTGRNLKIKCPANIGKNTKVTKSIKNNTSKKERTLKKILVDLAIF